MFRREFVTGDALQDLGDGGQNGAAVLEWGQLKFGPAAAEPFLVGEAAGGVMVVAEVLAAQGRAAAAVTVYEDVAAAVAPGWLLGWFDDLVWHGGSPPCT